jgi:Ca2+-binding RTX toxin-like protein
MKFVPGFTPTEVTVTPPIDMWGMDGSVTTPSDGWGYTDYQPGQIIDEPNVAPAPPPGGEISQNVALMNKTARPKPNDRANRLFAVPESFIKGSNADDTLKGDDQSNGISGLDGDDVITGLGGGDMITGGKGNDQIDGGKDLDLIYGGQGDDVLKGGQGDDYLQGDGGNDRLIGGGGKDEFAIQKGKGSDVIVDYKDGTDKLATFNVTFAELKVVQIGQDTALQFNNSTIALLQNVTASSITADDFVIPLPVLA